MKQVNVSPERQIAPLLFVALSVDAVVRPFVVPDQISAQSAVWAAAFSAVSVCAVCAVFFRVVSDRSLRLLRSGRMAQTKAVLLLFAAVTALSGGSSLVTTERFYRYVSDEPTLSLITAAIVLLAALYAVSRGMLTMTRAAGVICVLFAAGAALLLISAAGSMRIENLSFSAYPFSGAALRITTSCVFPAELLCFLLLKLPMHKSGARCIRRAVVWTALFFAGAAVAAELVLGARAAQQMQPLHTLARLGGLSVFKRFDALHVGIWLLALLMKQSLLLYGTRTAVRGLLPERAANACLPAAMALTLAGAFVCAAVPQRVVGVVLSYGTLAAFGGALLFSKCLGVEQ